jgi:hypothetical protein
MELLSLLIIIASLIISFFIIGITTLSVGIVSLKFSSTRSLAAIPLTPIHHNITDYAIAIQDYKSSYDYAISDATSFSFELDAKNFDYENCELDFYLIHNFYYYNFNLTVYSSNGNSIKNIKKDEIGSDERIQISSLPEKFRFNDYVFVNFLGPSPFTDFLQISDKYHLSSDIPLQLSGDYFSKKLLEIDFSETSKVRFEFNPFYGFPINFYSFPQVYIAGWSKNGQIALIITGAVFLFIFSVLAGLVIYAKIKFVR